MPSKFIYMCGIQYQHETGNEGPHDGQRYYNRIEDLKRERQCWQECGIIKVQLVNEEWVEEQDLLGKKHAPNNTI